MPRIVFLAPREAGLILEHGPQIHARKRLGRSGSLLSQTRDPTTCASSTRDMDPVLRAAECRGIGKPGTKTFDMRVVREHPATATFVSARTQ